MCHAREVLRGLPHLHRNAPLPGVLLLNEGIFIIWFFLMENFSLHVSTCGRNFLSLLIEEDCQSSFGGIEIFYHLTLLIEVFYRLTLLIEGE